MGELLQQLLRPVSYSYATAVRLRRRLYERAILGQRRLSCAVVSVGNLVVGGTGKTPVVESLARRYRAAGFRVGILSRGYRRRGSGLCVVSDLSGLRASLDDAGPELQPAVFLTLAAEVGGDPSSLFRAVVGGGVRHGRALPSFTESRGSISRE